MEVHLGLLSLHEGNCRSCDILHDSIKPLFRLLHKVLHNILLTFNLASAKLPEPFRGALELLFAVHDCLFQESSLVISVHSGKSLLAYRFLLSLNSSATAVALDAVMIFVVRVSVHHEVRASGDGARMSVGRDARSKKTAVVLVLDCHVVLTKEWEEKAAVKPLLPPKVDEVLRTERFHTAGHLEHLGSRNGPDAVLNVLRVLGGHVSLENKMPVVVRLGRKRLKPVLRGLWS